MPLVASTLEAALRLYSRVAVSERGSYRLVRFTRQFRPRRHWKSTFTTPDKLLLKLDLGTYPDCCMAFGLYELTTARMIKYLLKPGDHFIDAGANIGYFSMLGAQCVGPHGRVDAFEPHPDNHSRLIDHLTCNQLISRVNVHQIALADQPGHATIHTYPNDPHSNHGCASLFPQTDGTPKTHEICTDRLDHILPNANPRLIKMDIEGSEPIAIQGMASILSSPNPPMIIGEHNPDQAHTANTSSWLWVQRALDIQPNYQVFVIGTRLSKIDPCPISFENLGQVNLLLRPK